MSPTPRRPRPARRALCTAALSCAAALVIAAPGAHASPFWDRAHGPPAPRSAQLLPAEAWAAGLMQPIEISLVEATLLTTTGTERLRLGTEVAIPDLNVRVGLTDWLELGLTAAARAQLRMALLDEQRHEAPLSLAIGVEGGWKSAAMGLQLSKDLWAGDRVLRPTLGLWVGMHEWAARGQVPNSARAPERAADASLTAEPVDGVDGGGDDEAQLRAGELRVRERLWGAYLPLGVELDVPLNERAVLIPSVAYAVSLPPHGQIEVRCGDCLAGLAELDRRGLGMAWVGLRVEGRAPRARRPAVDALPRSPGDDTAPATAPADDPTPAAPIEPKAQPDPQAAPEATAAPAEAPPAAQPPPEAQPQPEVL